MNTTSITAELSAKVDFGNGIEVDTVVIDITPEVAEQLIDVINDNLGKAKLALAELGVQLD